MTWLTEALADTPALLYRHGESSGTTATDSSGNGRDGIYGGTASFVLGTEGLVIDDATTAVTFTNARIQIANAAWMDSDFVTVDYIVKPTSTANQWIVGRDHNGATTDLSWRLDIDTGVFRVIAILDGTSTYLIVTGTTTVVAGTRYHLTISYDGVAVRLYVNGLSEGTPAAAVGVLKKTGQPINIGATGVNSTPFVGVLKDLSVIPTALSAARILARYRAARTTLSGGFALLKDNFTRADSATVIGIPIVGGPYTVRSGTWGINANNLYLPTGLSGAHVTFPAAINLDISYRPVVSFSSSVQPTILFRWIDANNHWAFARTGGGQGALFRMLAGSYTQISAETPVVVGDLVQVKAYDDQIALFVNSTLKSFTFDPQFGVATSVAGVRSNGSGSSPRWDDLLVQEQTVPIFPEWTDEGFDGLDLTSDATLDLTPSLYKGRNSALADESETP